MGPEKNADRNSSTGNAAPNDGSSNFNRATDSRYVHQAPHRNISAIDSVARAPD